MNNFFTDLYAAKCFYWPNEQGQQWCTVLRKSARKEFEAARHETDPIIIARLIVVGQQCLEQLKFKFNDMEAAIKDRVNKTRVK